MLERILEPESMDSEEDAAEYDRMDHSAVNEAFVSDLIAAGFTGGDVLDLGTGTAQIPVAICRRVAGCRIMAADASTAMLDLARYGIEAAGMNGRIQLAHADAKRLPFGDRMFGAVISNSIIHHVPEPLDVLREAVRVLREGGLLFCRDLMRPLSAGQLDQLVERYAGCESARARQLFADSLRAALSLEEVTGLVVRLGFSPQSVQATSDRHWTFTARKPEVGGPSG